MPARAGHRPQRIHRRIRKPQSKPAISVGSRTRPVENVSPIRNSDGPVGRIDGLFSEEPDGTVRFDEATHLTSDDAHHLQPLLQRRILRLFQRRELLDAATVENMLTWQGSGGFSLDASVRIHGTDRAGHERDPGTRFLFLSGYTADAFGELGFLPGLDVFREKPITPTDLLAVVNELLRAASATHTSEAPRAA